MPACLPRNTSPSDGQDGHVIVAYNLLTSALSHFLPRGELRRLLYKKPTVTIGAAG